MSDRVPGYDLVPVNRESFVAALTRVLGAEAALERWNGACRTAALNPSLPEPAAQDLVLVAKALIDLGGLVSVVGSSMYVRLVTHRTLSGLQAAKTSGGTDE